MTSVVVHTKEAFLQGRNGLVDIGKICAWWNYDNWVYLDGYSRKRGHVINGGFGRIRLEEMDEFCINYLKERGKWNPDGGELIEETCSECGCNLFKPDSSNTCECPACGFQVEYEEV